MSKDTSGIYRIVNIQNNHCYVGSSTRLRKRKRDHFRDLRNGKHTNACLQKAFNRYGEDSLIFEILEIVSPVSLLLEREQTYIDILKPEYNILPVAGNSLGYKHTLEARQKMSAAPRKPAKAPVRTPEQRRKQAEALRGKPKSEATRLKMSLAKKGKPLSEKNRAAIAISLQSEESRRKRTASHTGIRPSVEVRAKLSKAKKGRVLPEETRRRMSESQKARWQKHKQAKEQSATLWDDAHVG